MRLALVDGDVLVYAGGFAADAQAKAQYIQRHGSDEGFDINEHHGPVEHALQAVKQKINSVMERTESDDKIVFLSHPVNFREQMFPEYKANRNVLHKPFWYREVQDYLFERQGAVYSEEGDEADDAMGRKQMEYLLADGPVETIIASIDKDMDMIPGLHYNWSKTREAEGVYEASDPECLRIFYTQMLTGDSTDNIPGMYKKLGIKASAQVKTPLETMTNVREMYDYVLQVYEGDKDFLALIGPLLWIKRTPDFWSPPRL
jgi:5'-3' exonuclease